MLRNLLLDCVTDAGLVLRYARRWMHYGVIAFALVCVTIAAIFGLWTRS